VWQTSKFESELANAIFIYEQKMRHFHVKKLILFRFNFCFSTEARLVGLCF